MTKEKKDGIKAVHTKDFVTTEDSSEAKKLFETGSYGVLIRGNKVQLTNIEALYLSEKGRIIVADVKGKEITYDKLTTSMKRGEKNFWVRYYVYKDMRDRGYIVKTALKFGAEFRVYDRGVKPGEDHAKWVLYPVSEKEDLTWYEFSAKNRVAHSTKKRLMIGVVDEENDVSYWEVRWIRP